jgi:predicted house-cleaning noncanonical NTP pyrophosphatase (MazG superfamily)
MIKFLCNKLGRDKGLEGFKAEGITPKYKILNGQEWQDALKNKLLEECHEVSTAHNKQEVISELADTLEVIDGICKAYDISHEEVEQAKAKKYHERGGFEKGLYIESLEMEPDNPKVQHFRASPDKYPEI